jgi:formate transporter
VVDKVLAIIFPVTAFVAMGFEHSVANMYFISADLVAKQQPEFLSLLSTLNVDQLTQMNFVFNNLLPVTLGNIVGAVVL